MQTSVVNNQKLSFEILTKQIQNCEKLLAQITVDTNNLAVYDMVRILKILRRWANIYDYSDFQKIFSIMENQLMKIPIKDMHKKEFIEIVETILNVFKRDNLNLN